MKNIGNTSIRKVNRAALKKVKSKANNLIKNQQYFNMHVILSDTMKRVPANTTHTHIQKEKVLAKRVAEKHHLQ